VIGRRSAPIRETLRLKAFRAVGIAQFTSLLGLWMHTVAAQWSLADSSASPAIVALVQTATTLPFLALGLPAGVLVDVVDRRRLLMGVHACLAVVAGTLGTVALSGPVQPVPLLVATLLLGSGQVIAMPGWQASIPEVVPREALASAAALSAAAGNTARVAGPAVGGLLVALSGPSAVFLVNAAAFLVVAMTVRRWPVAAGRGPAPERLGTALRTGVRYVRFSRLMRRLLVHAALFVLPASAVWALLPVVAHDDLQLGAAGYGVLFAALGVGAVLCAVLLAFVRGRTSPNTVLVTATTLFALGLAVVAVVHVAAVAAVALLLVGAGWVAATSTFTSTVQLALPRWVSGRGLATFMLVVQSSQAAGALLWGLVANRLGASAAVAIAAATLAATLVAFVPWGLYSMTDVDPVLAGAGDLADPLGDVGSHDGPVMVLVEYDVPPENVPEFLVALPPLQRSRRRTGARRWELFQDAADPTRFVETFVFPSWAERVRQHEVRRTRAEDRLEVTVRALAVGAPVVRHLLAAQLHSSRPRLPGRGGRSSARIRTRG
jgi:MFS family permease